MESEIKREIELTGTRKKRERMKSLVAYSFIAPNFIGFAVFTLIPIIFAFVLAFLEWDGNNAISFVGLNNFKALFGDTFFKKSLVNTVLYSIGTVPLTMITALALAMLLNQKIKGRAFFRTVAFFPYVASLVAITAVWSMIFHPSKGPVNFIIMKVFESAAKDLPNWFGKSLIMFTLIFFSVWKFMGYYMVIYLAGLQSISEELYEAASLDGANTWQKFRFVTWPQLKPTTFFVVVMMTINSFKVYDIVVMLAGGNDGKLGSTSLVLVYYIYQNAFVNWKLGYSSAVAMVLFALVLTVTLIQFRGRIQICKFINEEQEEVELKSLNKSNHLKKILIYIILILLMTLMLIPFLWMLSASVKTDREVFQMNPFRFIPEVPRWSNYVDIWTKIPFMKFVQNTTLLTIVVTFLQLFTSSFAAYSFAKLDFKYKNQLFLAYIATIAMPWQVYMVPQFIMMRNFGLNDKLLAMVFLQAFSAFGVFMMKQFYMSVPDSLCEAARIDGMNEYQIYYKIMLPLSKPALSTLTIFTFVNTWNDYLGPLIYLKSPEKKTIQLGLKMFIGQYSSEYGLIMAGSVLSLIPVLLIFIVLQKHFVQGIASTGLKG